MTYTETCAHCGTTDAPDAGWIAFAGAVYCDRACWEAYHSKPWPFG